MAKAPSKEVAEKKVNSLAVYDYGEDAGAGFDHMSGDDFAIPFLYLLQSNSPVVEQGEASAGMLMNTVSMDKYNAIKAKDEPGAIIIPCYTEHVFAEWRPQDAGGGLVGQHSPDADMVVHAKANFKFGELKTPDGNDLVDTFYCYIQFIKDIEAGEADPMVVAFNSTKIKVYKNLMTRIRSLKVPTPGGGRIVPPMWAHMWRLQSVMQTKNNKNFYNFDISFANGNSENSRLAPNHPIYQQAKEFHELCKDGGVRVATESMAREPGATEDAGEGTEVPF